MPARRCQPLLRRHFYADLGQGDGTFTNVDYDVTGAMEPSCDVVVDP